MDPTVYRQMAKLQERHWWFKGRRRIISGVIERLSLNLEPNILEVGCGTGGNLNMLMNYGNVTAMEKDDFARDFASKSSGLKVLPGSLPGNLGYINNKFDLICLFDVLEHIENDESALSCLLPFLKSDGKLLITVPAYPWLFGKHDVIHHHYRRYTKQSVSRLAENMNLKIVRLTYVNSFLFPVAVASKFADEFFESKKSLGSGLPVRWVNEFLFKVFSLENKIISHYDLPFGVSLITVLAKQHA
ncbi:MAG: class I SAM-dependent methyltransferase [Gammaproteobacteria bacterium]